MESYVQVGQTALRSPSGEILPAVPLFILARDAGVRNEVTGRTLAEELAITDITKLFAEKYKQYKEETGKRNKK